MDEADKASNPRRVAYLGKEDVAGTHKMYAAAVGADGRVYFGGRWMRKGSGGGLAWFDPKTGEVGGTWRPFSNYQIGYMTAAADGRYVVISTHGVSDTLLDKPKPDQGKLFMYDTTTRGIVRDVEPVAKARGAGLVLAVGGSRVFGWTEDPEDAKSSLLYGVDVSTGQVEFRKRLLFPLGVPIGGNQQEAFDFRLGPDGFVWTFMGGALVRLDPKDGSIRPVGRVHPGRPIAFAGNDLYLGGEAALRRVKGAARIAAR
jgi:hypothetical protein